MFLFCSLNSIWHFYCRSIKWKFNWPSLSEAPKKNVLIGIKIELTIEEEKNVIDQTKRLIFFFLHRKLSTDQFPHGIYLYANLHHKFWVLPCFCHKRKTFVLYYIHTKASFYACCFGAIQQPKEVKVIKCSPKRVVNLLNFLFGP